MESKSFFSKIIFVLLILTMLVSIIFADTNGIWERAADIQPGIFGSDEGYGPFAFWGTFLNLKETTLNVSTNTKAGIVSNSQNNNAITGIASKTGTSAIKGITNNNNAYSGYFSGGQFYVNSYPITFANSNLNDCTKLYTDTNGHVLCGVDYYLEPGYGLYKSGYNTINVNTNVIQNRVTGSCPNGAIKQINVDGSVSCTYETDPQVGQVTNGYWCRGTGTQVTCDQSPPVTSAGYGLYRSGNSLGVNTNTIQNRVTGSCPNGAIKQINVDGSVSCFESQRSQKVLPGTMCGLFQRYIPNTDSNCFIFKHPGSTTPYSITVIIPCDNSSSTSCPENYTFKMVFKDAIYVGHDGADQPAACYDYIFYYSCIKD